MFFNNCLGSVMSDFDLPYFVVISKKYRVRVSYYLDTNGLFHLPRKSVGEIMLELTALHLYVRKARWTCPLLSLASLAYTHVGTHKKNTH